MMDKEALALEKQIDKLPFKVEIMIGAFLETDGICVSNTDFVKIVEQAMHHIIFKVARGDCWLNWTTYAAIYQGQLITTRTTPFQIKKQEKELSSK